MKVRAQFISERINGEDDSTMEDGGEFAVATAVTNEYERICEKEDASYKVKQLLSDLSVKEQEVVCRKFGIGFDREYELDEIGEVLGYSGEGARVILKNALAKLKGRAKVLARLAM